VSRLRLKGRHWLALWLLLFLGVAAAVVTRQRAAILTARRLAELRDRRTTLEAARAELVRRIGNATSREVLVPRMERAGLHLPSDSENTRISVDTTAPDADRNR
jgi:hypothetical protein